MSSPNPVFLFPPLRCRGNILLNHIPSFSALISPPVLKGLGVFGVRGKGCDRQAASEVLQLTLSTDPALQEAHSRRPQCWNVCLHPRSSQREDETVSQSPTPSLPTPGRDFLPSLTLVPGTVWSMLGVWCSQGPSGCLWGTKGLWGQK